MFAGTTSNIKDLFFNGSALPSCNFCPELSTGSLARRKRSGQLPCRKIHICNAVVFEVFFLLKPWCICRVWHRSKGPNPIESFCYSFCCNLRWHARKLPLPFNLYTSIFQIFVCISASRKLTIVYYVTFQRKKIVQILYHQVRQLLNKNPKHL